MVPARHFLMLASALSLMSGCEQTAYVTTTSSSMAPLSAIGPGTVAMTMSARPAEVIGGSQTVYCVQSAGLQASALPYLMTGTLPQGYVLAEGALGGVPAECDVVAIMEPTVQAPRDTRASEPARARPAPTGPSSAAAEAGPNGAGASAAQGAKGAAAWAGPTGASSSAADTTGSSAAFAGPNGASSGASSGSGAASSFAGPGGASSSVSSPSGAASVSSDGTLSVSG